MPKGAACNKQHVDCTNPSHFLLVPATLITLTTKLMPPLSLIGRGKSMSKHKLLGSYNRSLIGNGVTFFRCSAFGYSLPGIQDFHSKTVGISRPSLKVG